jgi:hypothetical protein
MTDAWIVTRWVTGGFGVVRSRVMLLLLLNQEVMYSVADRQLMESVLVVGVDDLTDQSGHFGV